MGLSICWSIIEAHNGCLWASPGIHHGSVFHVILPTARAGAEPMKERSEVQPDVFVIGMCRVVATPAKADGVCSSLHGRSISHVCGWLCGEV